MEPTGRPYGYPRRNAFRQPVLERQLKDALARFGHVDALYGWRLDRYGQSADRVTLDLAGPAGEARQVTCDYLVGCDGAASRVREQQGIKLEGTTFDERWLIVDLENNENTTEHTEVFCDKRRPCITLPGPGASSSSCCRAERTRPRRVGPAAGLGLAVGVLCRRAASPCHGRGRRGEVAGVRVVPDRAEQGPGTRGRHPGAGRAGLR